jgi:hypothetical protein
MLGVIETLLDDGVLMFEEELRTIEVWLENDPDLITDIIKVHELASKNKDVIIAEHIYPAENGLVYELATLNKEEAMHLSIAVDGLGIRSKNLIVGVAYPTEDIDEGD